MEKAFFNWSGGKDSSMALRRILDAQELDVQALLTTVNKSFDRVSMHGVRSVLVKRQAELIGIPLDFIELPEDVDMKAYEDAMRLGVFKLKKEGLSTAVFGDIFLEDLREYRDKQLDQVDIKGVYPLWKENTKSLVTEFIDAGFKARVACVDQKVLDKSFIGCEMDRSFFDRLPDNVDPCGENGEFHSFVYDGPIFKEPVQFELGEVTEQVYKQKVESNGELKEEEITHGFWFQDFVPV